jgi:apolipoprotein N-acyltransferase
MQSGYLREDDVREIVFEMGALSHALIMLYLGGRMDMGPARFRALLRRSAWWSALLAFPGTWVSFEYLLNLVSPHGTAGSLSYSQLNFLPFLQLASVTGPWGMSFLLLLFSAALAIGVHLRHPARSRRCALLVQGWA